MSNDASPILEYRGVQIHRKEHVVLTEVDFQVSKGEFWYLIGRVGSGKSSLIKSFYAEVPVGGFEDSVARVFDYDLLHMRRRDIPMLRRRIGVVFQDFQLLTDRTVYQNLRFVLEATGWRDKQEMEDRIEGVLGEVGMINKSYKMPHELSGGEQQRVVIARALLNHPDLILADEPTGNLDPDAGEHVVELLNRIASSGTAVVMATHNLSLVSSFPGLIARCEDHRLICE